MSRSPDDKSADEVEVESYREPFKILAQMLRAGRSLSGRERNCCFLNLDGGRFADISDIADVSFPDDARGVALVDWDYDGDLDIWLLNRTRPRVRFMRNDMQTDHHFVAVRLQGTKSNRDAIGARVEVHLADSDIPLSKTLTAGHGFATQSTKWLHFGLGDSVEIEQIVVRWPGEAPQAFTGIAPDAFYRLIQGAETANLVTPPDTGEPLAPSGPPSTPPTEDRVRIGLVGPTPLPHLEYKTWENERRRLELDQSKLLLLNIWASWCEPCVKELNELTERSAELKARGLDILALTVDGFQNVEAEQLADSRTLLNRMRFPFDSGFVTVDLYEKLRLFLIPFVEVSTVNSLPTSFLITADGNVIAIYQGQLDVNRLLSDVRRAGAVPSNDPDLAIEFPGRWHVRFSVRDQLITLAAQYLTNGYERDSLLFSNRALQLDPDSELAQNNLRLATDALNDLERQASTWVARLDSQPNDIQAHMNLGMIRRQQRDVEAALTHFSKAAKNAPQLADSHLQLGLLLAHEGELTQAEASLQRVLQLEPRNQHAAHGLKSIETARSRQLGLPE